VRSRTIGPGWRGALLAACLVGLAIPDALAEGRHYLCRVAQPVASRDDRVVVKEFFTYSLSLASPIPGLELQFTCYPGAGIAHADLSRDSIDIREIANLNVANALGLEVQVEQRPRGTWNAEFDTTKAGERSARSHFYVRRLKAVLDLTELARRTPPPSAPEYAETMARFDAVVAATVDCMLDNASRSRPPIHNLELSVVGPRRYHRYAKAYRITPAPEPKQYPY